MLLSLRRHSEYWVLCGAALLIHLVTWHGYGWFRDEFYYIACARHLAWGYVDQPPFSIAILRVVISVFGESLHAIRTVPAMIHALTVLVVGLLTAELGGGRFARTVAMTAAAAAPEALALTFFYSMNAFDLLIWPAAALALLFALRTDRTSVWIGVGMILGTGLLNKLSVLWLGGGMAVALVCTPYRRVIGRRGPWIAAAVAAAIFMPHVAWQIAHGWPTLEFIHNASGSKMAARSPLSFAGATFKDEGAFMALLGLAGIVATFTRRMDPRARVLAWIWIVVFALLAVNGTSRTSYLTAAWNWTFALGGLAAEGALPSRHRIRRTAVLGMLAFFGVIALPMALPVLSSDAYVKYAAALGQAPSTEEKSALGRLPQFLADMNGWDAIVTTVDQAWRQLPPEERERATFFGMNYGDAGAVDVLGRRRGLPEATSGHNNYFLWGPPSENTDAMVMIAPDDTRWAPYFDHVVLAGETNCGDCMPYENHRRVYIAWGRRVPWAAVWPAVKHFE